MFVLADLPVGYSSRYTLHIKTNSKTGKTVLRRTDCYIFKLRKKKYACYRKKLLTLELSKYKTNRTAAVYSTTFRFCILFSAVCSRVLITTQGERQT